MPRPSDHRIYVSRNFKNGKSIHTAYKTRTVSWERIGFRASVYEDEDLARRTSDCCDRMDFFWKRFLSVKSDRLKVIATIRNQHFHDLADSPTISNIEFKVTRYGFSRGYICPIWIHRVSISCMSVPAAFIDIMRCTSHEICAYCVTRDAFVRLSRKFSCKWFFFAINITILPEAFFDRLLTMS